MQCRHRRVRMKIGATKQLDSCLALWFIHDDEKLFNIIGCKLFLNSRFFSKMQCRHRRVPIKLEQQNN
jgi:hypothetical protein